MWPWAHVAAAYLLYAGYRWRRDEPPPADVPTLALGIGALAPDLVDKPLAWWLQVLPNGRSLAHSLLVAGVVLVVGYALVRRTEHASVFGAFALGYVAHIAGDALHPLLVGDFSSLHFLAWPVTTPPAYELVGVLVRIERLELTPFVGFELVVTAAGVILWWRQGRPGPSALRRWVRPGDRIPS